ncbi:MAG: LptF/LptG family permease [Deltaproteobacteria bacterium]|nr:LptF/LptG family permease [Deltaproteobacteria bacterium]
MFRLIRYLLRQLAPWLGIAVAGAVLLFLTTQLVRVVPVFIGAGASPAEIASGLGLLLVPVIGWSLTPAFAIAVFAVVGRMDADGELTAIDAAGIGRPRLVVAPLLAACMLAVVAAWIWLDAGPRSQAALRAMADELAGRAIAGQIHPGRFVEPIAGVTVYADRGEGARYEGVVIEDQRDRTRALRLVARQAAARYDPVARHLELRLLDGTAFLSDGSDGRPMALSYEQLDIGVSAIDEISSRLGFLPWLMAVPTSHLVGGPRADGVDEAEWGFALWRRIAGPCGLLALAVAAIVLALGGRWRNRSLAVAAAGGLFLAYHLLCRLGESLALTGTLDPAVAALGPSALVLLLSLVFGLSFPKITRV